MILAVNEPFLAAALIAFVGLLLFAAGCDVSRFVIPNTVSVAIVAVFVVALVASPLEFAWLDQMGALALVFAVGWALFTMGLVGGGDVKLMAAIAPWYGLSVLPSQLAYVAISGGLLALTLVGLRAVTPRIAAAAARRPDVRLPRVLTAGEPMPYGVAIACGTVLAIQKTPLLAALVT